MKRSMAVATLATLVFATGAVAPGLAAQEAPPAPVLEISGLVGSTFFAQDQAFGFGNGQSAVWARAGQADHDPWFFGGDVRNTRFRLALEDARTEGLTVRAVVELDFFGAFNGTGPFSDEQPQPRLRLAYVDFGGDVTRLRIGQMFTPLFGAVPVSVAHVAFPLGFGSGGVIGWRQPGILLSHRLLHAGETELRGQVGAFRGSWLGPGTNLDHQSAGESASIPQLEARLDLTGEAAGADYSVYAVGHYDVKDLSGVGPDTLDLGDLAGWAVAGGGTADIGRLGLRGNVYRGRAIGQQFGQLSQFGDISSWGGWVQAGVRLDPRWSVWGFAGMDDPDDDELLAALPDSRRVHNHSTALLLRYQLYDYQIGLEYLRAVTRWAEGTGPGIDSAARQFSLSVLYVF